MIDIDDFISLFSDGKIDEKFVPSEVNLPESFPSADEDFDALIPEIEMEIDDLHKSYHKLIPRYPIETEVIALDTTSFVLGEVEDGIVGAIRGSMVIKPRNETKSKLELYGPRCPIVTNQNKDELYERLFSLTYNRRVDSNAPDIFKMVDRIRNLFERFLQLKIAKSHQNAILLFDGSLIGDTIANPKSAIQDILTHAKRNNNSVVAISKSTNLSFKKSKKNILSVLDNQDGECYVSGIRNFISQNRERYIGDIYVSKLTYSGEPFRIDIDPESPIGHDKILGMVAGLAGDYGYPEELKLAHSTCILSAVEIIGLQSIAMSKNFMHIGEDIRKKIFPLG